MDKESPLNRGFFFFVVSFGVLWLPLTYRILYGICHGILVCRNGKYRKVEVTPCVKGSCPFRMLK